MVGQPDVPGDDEPWPRGINHLVGTGLAAVVVLKPKPGGVPDRGGKLVDQAGGQRRDGLAEVAPCLPFDEVYRRHAGAVYHFCLSQVGHPAVAEDVAAETFTSAFSAYERTRPDEAGLRPWLLRIARNAAVDHHRRQGRLRGFLGRLTGHGETESVEAVVMLRAELTSVILAMRRLSSRDRQLIGLRVAAGLSFAEIAVVTGTREAASRVATHRALQRLRALIESRDRGVTGG